MFAIRTGHVKSLCMYIDQTSRCENHKKKLLVFVLLLKVYLIPLLWYWHVHSATFKKSRGILGWTSVDPKKNRELKSHHSLQIWDWPSRHSLDFRFLDFHSTPKCWSRCVFEEISSCLWGEPGMGVVAKWCAHGEVHVWGIASSLLSIYLSNF